jgi:hypothetical protein
LQIGEEGEKIIINLLTHLKDELKEIKLKVALDNKLTKKGLESVSQCILACQYLSRL